MDKKHVPVIRDQQSEVAKRKAELRGNVWNCLEAEGAVWFPRPCHGRVPNCFGSADACWWLLQLPELKDANVVKVHPSIGATALRTALVLAGKVVLVPPNPGEDFLYLQLEASSVGRKTDLAKIGDKRVYPKWAKPLTLKELPTIDACIVATVAVEPDSGRRLGKGKGYGEMEYGILRELGAVTDATPIYTICHDLQVLESSRFPPMEPHDLAVDAIATPTRLLRVSSRLSKPCGVLWDRVSEEMQTAIGALEALRQLPADELNALRKMHAAGALRVQSNLAASSNAGCWEDAVNKAWAHAHKEEEQGWWAQQRVHSTTGQQRVHGQKLLGKNTRADW